MNGNRCVPPPAGRTLVWLLAGACCWSLAHADSFRCGRKVVRNGDSEAELIARCGEPDRRDSGYEALWLSGGQQRVRVERWHYRTGARRLERVVLVYRGEVVAVRSGSR